MLDSTRAGASYLPVKEVIPEMAQFEIRPSGAQYYWVFQADNNEIICTSERYTSKQSALLSIDVVKRSGPGASINEKS